MNIDESDTENIVIHRDERGGGKTGAQSTRTGGKQSTLDSTFTPDCRIRGEEEDEDNGYTRVTWRATRSTSSPMNTRVAKKATPIKSIIRVMEGEGREAAKAVQADQLTFLRTLVESVLRQLQEQAGAHKASAAEAINARCRATQVAVDNHDINAVILHTAEQPILIISCYEPRDEETTEDKEEALAERTHKMKEAITEAEEITQGSADVLICADLNRYHPIWGGQETLRHTQRIREGEQVVSFMHEAALQSLLNQGTVTWEYAALNLQSTIDLILGSKGIQERLISCTIYGTDHGSDHKAIATQLDYGSDYTPPKKGKRQYTEVDWDKIRTELEAILSKTLLKEELGSTEELDDKAEFLTSKINEILENRVPRARRSLYNRRWWTRELTELRTEYTTRRNRIVTLRRRGEDTERARHLASAARRTFYNAVEKQRKDHWKAFLDDTDNVWKAAKYARKKEALTNIPDLTMNSVTADTDLKKAEVLINTFFPQPPKAEEGIREPYLQGRKPKWPELTIHEVREAIFKSSKDRAPGLDELTFRAWHELWPVTGPYILWLYRASIETGHIPVTWKTVRIVVIRKPGKADYTIPKAYRPISLIQTLSKG
jgi:exonuclease III